MNKCTTLLLTLTIAMPLMAQQPKQTPAPQSAAPNSLPAPAKDDTVVEEIVARVNN